MVIIRLILAMTSVFREVLSHFQYLVFYTHEEIVAADDVSEPPAPELSKKNDKITPKLYSPKVYVAF